MAALTATFPPSLSWLRLTRCGFRIKSCEALAAIAPMLPALRQAYLFYNELDSSCVSLLCKFIIGSNVESLKLQGSHFGEEGKAKILKTWAASRTPGSSAGSVEF